MRKAYSIKTDISLFLDHRKFLLSVEEELKAEGEFSHRTLNRACGFSSPNFIQLVIQGKRNLSVEGAKKIAQALGLSRDQTKFFVKMVVVNSEVDPSIRLSLFEDLLREPLIANRHRLSQEQLEFYSKWYNVVIREILQVAPELTAVELSEVLVPKISEAAVLESLEVMKKLKLIERDSGRWKVLHPQIESGNEIIHQALIYFHSATIELGKEALTRFKGAQRETSAMTLRLTEEEFRLLKEKIREFKKETLAGETAAPDAQVYQFNFQLFPVTKNLKGTTK